MPRRDVNTVDIARNLSDASGSAPQPPRSKWAPRQTRSPAQLAQDQKQRSTGKARATGVTGVKSARCLQVAEHWVALGEDQGVKDPASAKWLSNQIYDRVNKQDKVIGQLLRKENGLDRTQELLEKMCEVYWNEYAGTHEQEYVFDFLSEKVWDDVRYYADMYLKVSKANERNVVIPQPVYDRREDQEMHKALEAARIESWVERQQQWIRDHPEWLDMKAPIRVSSGELLARMAKIQERNRRET